MLLFCCTAKWIFHILISPLFGFPFHSGHHRWMFSQGSSGLLGCTLHCSHHRILFVFLEFLCVVWQHLCCVCTCVFECEGVSFLMPKHTAGFTVAHSWQKHQPDHALTLLRIRAADGQMPSDLPLILCAASVLAETQQNGLHTQTVRSILRCAGRGRISS